MPEPQKDSTMSIRVGIVGISGFGGGEAMRLVASHPSFELIYAAGAGSAGSRLVGRFPGVPAKLVELVIEKWDPVTLPKLDVLFASLPTGASVEAKMAHCARPHPTSPIWSPRKDPHGNRPPLWHLPPRSSAN